MSILIAGSRVDISPKTAVQMGCGNSDKRTSRTDLEIEANLLLLDTQKEKYLFIAIDALYAGNKLKDYLDFVFKSFNINIYILASHTHSAPQLDDTKEFFYLPDSSHFDFVNQELKNAIYFLLHSKKTECEIEIYQFLSNAAISRRYKRFVGGKKHKLKFNQVFMGPNWKDLNDYKGYILLLKNQGKVISIIWNYPCHPVSIPKEYGHHSHFPGVIRNYFRKTFQDSKLPVLFFQGFSGDLRPRPKRKSATSILSKIRFVILGPWSEDFDEVSFRLWVQGLWSDIQKRTLVGSDINFSKLAIASTAKSNDNFYETNNKAAEFLEVTVFKIKNLILLMVSGEVVYPYFWKISNLFPEFNVMAVGCLNNVVGYIPTQTMIVEGGYESTESLHLFNLLNIHSNFENKILETFKATILETIS